MAQDVNAIISLLKPKFDFSEVHVLGAPEDPLWAMIAKKKADFNGLNENLAVQDALPPSISNDFGTAMRHTQGSEYLRFVVPRRRCYGLISVTTEAIRASKGKDGSLVEAWAREIKNGIRALSLQLAAECYRNSGGALGQITSGQSTTTVTLANKADVFNFQRNMFVQTAQDDGSGATPAGTNGSGAEVQIVGLDPDAGTLTIAGAGWSTQIPGTTGASYIFRSGGYAQAAFGLLGWLPTTAPTSGDNWCGLDRSGNPAQLAGIRVASKGTMEETAIYAADRVVMGGGKPDILIVNNLDRASFIATASTKVVLDRTTKINEVPVDFASFQIIGPKGLITVFASPLCPQGKAFLLERDKISYRSIGPAPGILGEEEGFPVVYPDPNNDGWLLRLGVYGNFFVEAPGHHAVITW